MTDRELLEAILERQIRTEEAVQRTEEAIHKTNLHIETEMWPAIQKAGGGPRHDSGAHGRQNRAPDRAVSGPTRRAPGRYHSD